MLLAAAARAIINMPLTIHQGGWGAQTHVTPSRIGSDFWLTALVLSDGKLTTVIIDMDLGTVNTALGEQLRNAVAQALNISKHQVRVSATHTHAGPVVGRNTEDAAVGMYIRYLIEQAVSASLEALRRLVPVTVQAEYGVSYVGKNRRQTLPDGKVITGYEESGAADPTVTVVRFGDERGAAVANIVHYACHPTTLGYTNDIASPDYPGVVKRFVEQTIGGTCLFLQGAAGDIGPGPGGFLDRMDVVQDIGLSLGCAAAQTLLEAKNKQFSYTFSKVVESGASLGIWERELVPSKAPVHQTVSRCVKLPLKQMEHPDELEKKRDMHQAELNRLRAVQASDEELRSCTFQYKRANLILGIAKKFYGQSEADIEVQIIQIGEIAMIGVPLEPFSAIGVQIREQSPFRYTMVSGYTNGSNGYLPTADEFPRGGYEPWYSAFAPDAADKLVAQIVGLLHEMRAKHSPNEGV
jgi:hypothetical protein